MLLKQVKQLFFRDLGPVCLKYQLLKVRFLFIYLADTFIQSDLQCIQAIHVLGV